MAAYDAHACQEIVRDYTLDECFAPGLRVYRDAFPGVPVNVVILTVQAPG